MTFALLAGLLAGLLGGGVVAWSRHRARVAADDGHRFDPADEAPLAASQAVPRQRPAAARPAIPAPKTSPDPLATASFRAVVIRTGSGCCDAVRALAGQRFLASEAPGLPVAGCNRTQCRCSFQRLGDRRGGDERRFGLGSFGGFGTTRGQREQRAGRDRRRD